MHWSEQIFRYCERGHAAGLMAEPLNAVSNLAFLAVACVAARRLGASGPAVAASGLAVDATRTVTWAMVLLVALIGLGSFLFHVLATRWAQLADVIPIGVFMLVYLVFALRVLLGLRWPGAALGLGAFVLALAMAMRLCPPAEDVLSPACLNGTAVYAPALLAMAAIGIVLRLREHRAAGAVLAAATLFLISMLMRSADIVMCDATRLAGHPAGLHVLWHLINAAVLHLLLTVATRAADPSPALPG